ncbi:hypothetical protein pb186bvf_009767 [Paramecium bursaria]
MVPVSTKKNNHKKEDLKSKQTIQLIHHRQYINNFFRI